MPSYARPTRIDDALGILDRERPRVLAGGTDLYASPDARLADTAVLDLSAIHELHGIHASREGWRIGASTTWTQVCEAKLPPQFDALKLAGREIGGRQVQNAGTIAGNLCNASPAADGTPALLALDASVELAGAAGTRTLAVREFVLGPRRTALQPGELVTAILVPKPAHAAQGTFLKLGARKYLLISIAMVGAVVEVRGDVIAAARLAVGSCSPVAQRLPALEAHLAGVKLAPGIGAHVQPAHLEPLSPIDDVRATAAYRREAALELVRRALESLAAPLEAPL